MTVMTPEAKETNRRVVVAAVSGGPDSVYLLLGKLAHEKGIKVVVGHVNYGTRGKDSSKDQIFVENICKSYQYKTDILLLDSIHSPCALVGPQGNFPVGFERKAREIRYRFLKNLSEKAGAEAIALAHTADDQVETILMRVFEGAGIGGLKGIPRRTEDGIVRPILDIWKEDILTYLKKRKIPYRTDRSNVDTRFERNWVRNVLLPLLVKRYGKAVKKRIFTLGERFRELDDYLEAEAGRWIRKNIDGKLPSIHRMTCQEKDVPIGFRKERYSILPTVLRVKVLQRICFEHLGVEPNERLLKAMDRNICDGGPSARVSAGKGWILANRYEEALFLPGKNGRDQAPLGSALGKKSGGNGKIGNAPKETMGQANRIAVPGGYELPAGPKGGVIEFQWGAMGEVTAAQAKRLAEKGDAEVFDLAGLTLPLTVRPLRAGDRIRPFGGSACRKARGGEKKVKEILIDRKIPRDDRWGRPVVCDASGAILWIPGVLRSACAPVTRRTRKTALLRIRAAK